MAYRTGRFAALDIGTVTCRMLVADVDGGALTEVDKEYRITDLGVGVDAAGRLQEAAMARVMAAVDDYLAVLARFDSESHPVRGLIAMATSAARDASNAQEFTALLAERGVTLTVIPGEREAALTFAGASSDFPQENLLVVDIGGGSTEIVAGRAGALLQRGLPARYRALLPQRSAHGRRSGGGAAVDSRRNGGLFRGAGKPGLRHRALGGRGRHRYQRGQHSRGHGGVRLVPGA